VTFFSSIAEIRAKCLSQIRLGNIQCIGAAITAKIHITISAFNMPINYKYEKSRYCMFTVTCGQLQLQMYD